MVIVVDTGLAVPRKREVPPVEVGWRDPFGAAVFAFSGLQPPSVTRRLCGPQARASSVMLVRIASSTTAAA